MSTFFQMQKVAVYLESAPFTNLSSAVEYEARVDFPGHETETLIKAGIYLLTILLFFFRWKFSAKILF